MRVGERDEGERTGHDREPDEHRAALDRRGPRAGSRGRALPTRAPRGSGRRRPVRTGGRRPAGQSSPQKSSRSERSPSGSASPGRAGGGRLLAMRTVSSLSGTRVGSVARSGDAASASSVGAGRRRARRSPVGRLAAGAARRRAARRLLGPARPSASDPGPGVGRGRPCLRAGSRRLRHALHGLGVPLHEPGERLQELALPHEEGGDGRPVLRRRSASRRRPRPTVARASANDARRLGARARDDLVGLPGTSSRSGAPTTGAAPACPRAGRSRPSGAVNESVSSSRNSSTSRIW